MKLLRPLIRAPQAPERSHTALAMANALGSFAFQGSQFPIGVNMTVPGTNTETMENHFGSYVLAGLKSNGIVYALELVRMQVFSQARFQFRRRTNGQTGDLFGTPALIPLEQPWLGGTTGQLLKRTLLDADLAGNGYNVLTGGQILRLRPDWVDIILQAHPSGLGETVHSFVYWRNGVRGRDPVSILPGNMAHFTPSPDPLASFRGMSWLTPVVRELAGDDAYQRHRVNYVDNAATPNLAVTMKEALSRDAFLELVDAMEEAHAGPVNAGKTLYLAGGADVTVVGSDMAGLDYKAVQGAGETRLAAAAGVGAVIAQFSEGLQGSALTQGNYAAARRRFADVTMRDLWRDVAGAFAPLIAAPAGAELWYDARDIPFLQEDEKDAADIRAMDATTLNTLVTAGYLPDAAVAFVQTGGDLAQLTGQHSGKFSVQLQAPGAEEDPPASAVSPATLIP